MTINEFPDRIITIDGVDHLYFGGTNYLGMTINVEFQNILFQSIKKWGTAYGSSRNSNIKLSIYDTAEKLLAKNMDSAAALTVSSGMLAGKLVIEHLSKITNLQFHFPETHPALLNDSSLPIRVNEKLNPKIFDSNVTKITIVADSIPSLCVKPMDLSILFEIPKEKEINLVIDESHTLGIYGNEWQKELEKENINIIKTASLGKALGLSGGVIAGNDVFMSGIRNLNSFIGASGMNPAFLETYINSQELYQSQKEKLKQNLHYMDQNFINREGFTFHGDYPNIYFESEAVSNRLLENKIITTCFKYPTSSGKLNRIVITSNHVIQDLKQLISHLN